MPYHDKNSLGQNFIKYPSLVRELIGVASLQHDDLIIEVGSGKGIITKELRKISNNVIAIEKDEKLAKDTGAIYVDFLDFELPKEKYKVFSNIPFSITSEIISKFLTADNMPEEMYLIMQQEAAEKYLGVPTETQSSILMKPFFEVEILGDIDRTNFVHKPQVKIVFVKFTKRQKFYIAYEDRNEFRKFVMHGFSQWQPTWGKSYKKILTENQIYKIESIYKIKGKKLTEVNFDTWLQIFKTLNKIKALRYQ